MNDREKYKNRLANEKSPYLLQHADNPVDWYPWGEEAFEEARKKNKPVFLSIGYSTCHWCHVMEHESFLDTAVAGKLNEYFVPIKVDREERPDIDHIYMTAVQAMTGQGGWPLTVILTPDKKPFFGGTYFPPFEKWGHPGLMDIMESVHRAWEDNGKRLVESGDDLTNAIRERSVALKGKPLGEETLRAAFENFNMSYDPRHGGFGSAPKFPTGHNLSFLLRYWQRTKVEKALAMVEHTLVQMAQGGIYDHLGGGFHRYSTDQMWQIPHFEKMLYDQAILGKTYLEAYQITKNEFYAKVAREVFDYVLKVLKHPQGGFYSAEDADSPDPDIYDVMSAKVDQRIEKKEGAFYLWRSKEIENVLGEEEAAIFNDHFGVLPDGNARHDPHGEFVGKNVIFVERPIEETARAFSKTPAETATILRRCQKTLLSLRDQRPRPFLDDKILVDWNGLMISSLAIASKVLHEPRYLDSAIEAAQFIFDHLMTKEGRLWHRYRDGDSAIPGTVEDYAFFVHGLMDLYEATFDVRYLKEARDLAKHMVKFFWDELQGGFYLTASDAEELIFRPKEAYDGAIPSGNSLAALDLVRLYHFTLNKEWEDKLKETIDAFSFQVASSPNAYTQMLMVLDFILGPSQEIVMAGNFNDFLVERMKEEIYQRFLPRKVIIFRPVSENEYRHIVALSPFVKEQEPLNGGTTAYICENHLCQLPVSDFEAFQRGLETLR